MPFALPPLATPGDRLPDVWLRFDSGERIKLHKALGGRPLLIASGIPATELPRVDPAQVDAIWIGTTVAQPGWRAVSADPDWCALFAAGVYEMDANFRVVRHWATDHVVQPNEMDAAVSHAPVLLVPRVLEPELCAALVRHFEDVCAGGEASHVLVLENGEQVPTLAPEVKARRESPIRDTDLEAAVHARMLRRVVPEIARVFQFQVARRDPFKLLGYAAGAGYFHAHRDNDTPDVAYRRFAISVNLDAAAYTGGAFRFPEFGDASCSPPTGTALVFSCSLLHAVTPVTRGVRHAVTTFVA